MSNWPFRAPFRITGRVFDSVELCQVVVRQGDVAGRGEAAGVLYRGDLPADLPRRVEAIRGQIESGIGRHQLRDALPAGGARNALDCALWDLESQLAGEAVWTLAGLPPPEPLVTAHTLGAEHPQVMARHAAALPEARLLKLKLTGETADAARVSAVRAARPDGLLMIDANQGFTLNTLAELMPTLVACGVVLIEQPLPIGREADLEGFGSPIPIAADESVQGLSDMSLLPGRFDAVNIKLDKCGGLTEALLMVARARELGLQVMVGNMFGTSLAMAPAFILGQLCDFADLDGPTFLAADIRPSMRYEDGLIRLPADLWGSARRTGAQT
ncbi:MAG: dipeptide epimerase [Caulobacterales bacterium]|nr:dipeptide epimerase [Caulobacterales bacterium]